MGKGGEYWGNSEEKWRKVAKSVGEKWGKTVHSRHLTQRAQMLEIDYDNMLSTPKPAWLLQCIIDCQMCSHYPINLKDVIKLHRPSENFEITMFSTYMYKVRYIQVLIAW